MDTKPKLVITQDRKAWYGNDGFLHREDGPAIQDGNGNEEWYLNGLLHREDGPAIQDRYGNEEWYLNSLLHREDGPAARYVSGDFDEWEKWYIHGKKHRVDGPAVTSKHHGKWWYVHGKLHREDGPAVEYSNGDKAWFVNGYNSEFFCHDHNIPYIYKDWPLEYKILWNLINRE